MRACIAVDLPVIVHTRDAEDDTIRILEDEGKGTRLRGLLHCFTSQRYLAEWAVDFGFYVSFSGIITFKKSQDLRDTAKALPLDKLLIETDSPFLAPEPYRGKNNEPAYVYRVCETLAELHGISNEEMARITTDNFFTLFDKAKC